MEEEERLWKELEVRRQRREQERQGDKPSKLERSLEEAAAVAYPEEKEKQEAFLKQCEAEEVTIKDLLEFGESLFPKLGLKLGPSERLLNWKGM